MYTRIIKSSNKYEKRPVFNKSIFDAKTEDIVYGLVGYLINEDYIDKKQIEFLYNIIKESPYIIKIYNYFNYNEKQINQLDSNLFIRLELMKKYNNCLNNYKRSLSILQFQHILKYLLLIQLELFNYYGFIHRNIKLSNIMIEKNKNRDIRFFISNNFKSIIINSKYKLLLSDFDKSKILFRCLNPEIINFFKNKSNIIYENSLEYNIINTFYECIKLLDNNNIYNKFIQIINSYNIDKRYIIKKLSSYSRKEINEYVYKKDTISNCIFIISTLFDSLFNNYSFLNKI